MNEPTPTTPFAVFGLYRNQTDPAVIHAVDVADARRQFHDRYSGIEGTTLYVKTLEELTEESDG